MKFFLLLTCLFFGAASAAPSPVSSPISLRVMTFNVMCDFCSKGEANGTFSERLAAVADTINRHDPDLVSLQEIRTEGQVEELLSRVHEKYTPIFAEGFLVSYTDPVLLVRKSRFTVVQKDGFWLGPSSPDFGLGWKTSFPRRVEYAELNDSSTREAFVFVGAHFDNNPRNREPSADLVVKYFQTFPLSVIFAADTNLRPDREGYQKLSKAFRDTFREVELHPYVGNQPSISTDGCNLEKAPDFPLCRVDHVFLSRKLPWKTRSWRLDTFRYPGTKGFISDHRALVVELTR